jgi:hypothetical protein
MLGGVTTDLAKSPGAGSLKVVLWLIDKGVLEGGNTFGDNNGHGKGVVEG